MKFVAYYRVSTYQQERSGLGLEAQRFAVRKFVGAKSGILIKEFTEIGSGAKNERPLLLEAMAFCSFQRATLVIDTLDRLSRRFTFIANVVEAGIDIAIVDMPIANKITLHIVAAVAEQERAMMCQRISAALHAAVARGTKLGFASPTRTDHRQVIALAVAEHKRRADQFAISMRPQIRAARANGATSCKAVAIVLNETLLRTHRNRLWTGSIVRSAEHRIHNLVRQGSAIADLAPSEAMAAESWGLKHGAASSKGSMRRNREKWADLAGRIANIERLGRLANVGLAQHLNGQGVLTFKGKAWTTSSVAHHRRRLKQIERESMTGQLGTEDWRARWRRLEDLAESERTQVRTEKINNLAPDERWRCIAAHLEVLELSGRLTAVSVAKLLNDRDYVNFYGRPWTKHTVGYLRRRLAKLNGVEPDDLRRSAHRKRHVPR